MDTVTLEPRNAPRAARRLVAAGCASAATGPECADAAALMTSEVVTNAVLHGAGAITFRFQAGTLLVRVEVGDDNAGKPRPGELDEHAEGGRGMLIVKALSAEWGVLNRPGGKIVWFTLPTQP